jgi:hypothetical protein
VFLKNNGDPEKIRFQYELFLGSTGFVIHNRCEKITFLNPSPFFQERLLKGGGVRTNLLIALSPQVLNED